MTSCCKAVGRFRIRSFFLSLAHSLTLIHAHTHAHAHWHILTLIHIFSLLHKGKFLQLIMCSRGEAQRVKVSEIIE